MLTLVRQQLIQPMSEKPKLSLIHLRIRAAPCKRKLILNYQNRSTMTQKRPKKRFLYEAITTPYFLLLIANQ